MSPPTIINKTQLVKNFQHYLNQGVLTQPLIAQFLQYKKSNDKFILQSSSGTQGKPLLIPRTLNDMNNIATRTVRFYVNHYQQLPKRVASLGGISHIQAARQYQHPKIELRYFKLDELDKIPNFSPEVITCYPSVAREIVANTKLNFPDLKAIRLGGEPVFSADIDKLFARFANIIVIEQYGSTEMPAIAFRVFKNNNKSSIYHIENSRYHLLTEHQQGWQPIIVKDLFEDLAVNISDYYDTGDEGLFYQGRLTAIRRANDATHLFQQKINELLAAGCVNVQFFIESQCIHYTGLITLPNSIPVNNQIFTTKKNGLQRTPQSNKLILVLP